MLQLEVRLEANELQQVLKTQRASFKRTRLASLEISSLVVNGRCSSSSEGKQEVDNKHHLGQKHTSEAFFFLKKRAAFLNRAVRGADALVNVTA